MNRMKLQIGKSAIWLIVPLVLTNCNTLLAQTERTNVLTFRDHGTSYEYTEADRDEIKRVVDYVQIGKTRVRKFFGASFPKKFLVQILPNRKSLNETWRKDWNLPDFESECWMVASGTGEKLTILSPGVWKKEACEHDPADTREAQMLLTHELVHVFNGQVNPNPNFEGMDDIGWFSEGIAVLASGQLDTTKRASAKEAIELGRSPAKLTAAWSGKYRYGVSGSLVDYIDRSYGRKTSIELLAFTTQKQILDRLGISETELLSRWKQSVLAEAQRVAQSK